MRPSPILFVYSNTLKTWSARLSSSGRRNKRGEGLANGGEYLFRGDIAHAAVMNEAADRPVTWLAIKFAGRLDRCRQWIERRPMPRAGRAEYSDSRGSECGGDMQKSGIV
jgi:hypothetical protein